MPETADPPDHNNTISSSVTNLDIETEYIEDKNQKAWSANQQINGHVNGQLNGDGEEGEQQNGEHPDAPPAKRQKLAEGGNGKHKESPRPISPPWKRFEAEGPTAFLENGKRRSARTNAIPLELQPQTAKRTTRTAHSKAAQKPAKPVYNNPPKSKPDQPRHVKTPSIDNAATRRTSTSLRPSSRGTAASPTIKREPKAEVKKETSKKTPMKTTPKKQKEPSQSSRKSARTLTKAKQEEVAKAQNELDELAAQSDSDDSEESSLLPNVPLLLKKVSFRVSMPKPAIMTPANIPMKKQYGAFEEFIQQDQIEEPGTRQPLSTEQIRKEAARRLFVQRLSQRHQMSTPKLPPRQPEPPKQYSHRDHLLAHVNYFQFLMRKEKKEHRRNAEIIAHEAKRYVEAKQAKGRVKTKDEIEREQTLQWIAKYKTVIKDVGRLWQAVEAEVNAARVKQYEQEQQEKIKGHLNRVLDRTDAMLKRHDTDLSTSEVEETDLDDGSDDDSDDDKSENSEQMSASGSESNSSVEADLDPDATMTLEELKAKYENVPEIEPEPIAPLSEQDEVEADAEESDPETVMDSELDSNEDEDGEDDDEDEDYASDDNEGGLLSLFSKKEIEDMGPAEQDEQDGIETADAEMQDAPSSHVGRTTIDIELDDAKEKTLTAQSATDDMDLFTKTSPDHNAADVPLAEVKSLPANQASDADSSREPSDRNSPGTSATKATEAESMSSVERQESQQPQDVEDSDTKHMTPVPSLLRGTLRTYQHEGLDWLANLYAGGRSGILADEMGLGKTIQSIALLAHLATTYEVWGPHLIVVPTSVMLNWEMEFKKFLPGFKILTYYGDQKERKQKRRGWLADDAFNVVITSYQLVLQDASSFKRRRWHYMILDEAHNIKNFRSERWQTMMTFNTRARLLLTGTPLQNNLTELWSLLFFLHYGQESDGQDDAFAGLREWSEWFKRPVESILEHGKQVLDQEDQEQVAKLHKVIRPFLLRRLKRDVEKQMPLKYEHVEMCRLSKRQRQLYDGFMSRTQTRETLASGNYLSIINALMQLRKVCNHPDLFETRPINTSFAMPRSIAAEFEVTDLLLRRKLFSADPYSHVDLDFLELVPISRESMSKQQCFEVSKWNAYQPLKDLRERQWQRVRGRSKIFASADRGEVMSSLENVARQSRLQLIERSMYYDAYKHHQHPLYGCELLRKVDLAVRHKALHECSLHSAKSRSWEHESVFKSVNLVQSLETRSRNMQPFIEKYACLTPAAMAVDLPVTVVGESRANAIRHHQAMQKYDPFHQAQMKLSIAFPDKRLLQYDCGKLQRLDKLLRRLQAGGHRALIFTQMTKVLDILEQFLNIHGHRYLRLDGATKIEQRQILTDRFNNDTRILAFILSSRSGGLGINLTGADTVIFYDLDWNPAMDRQCTDRAHRIGQTRDVHIYRFVSEHTIESNILRKANQKQLLDDVVIQEGDFTTDYLNNATYKDMLDDHEADEDDVAGAAMDRVLGGNLIEGKNKATAFEQAEDREDIAAARVAEKEVQNADDGDFDDTMKPAEAPKSKQNALNPFGATDAAIADADEAADNVHHIDEYMLKLQHYLLKNAPLVIKDKSKRRRDRKKGGDTRRR